jgi:cytochrome c oxidase assembly protein subunit 15
MNMHPSQGPFPAAKSVALWLWLMCTLILMMVAVGGITRITESGLSMVNWRPIMGTLPPRSPEEWNHAFDLYKATPQYVKFSAEGEMTLAHFKEIFFWEYVHRLLGRVIGLAYALPLAWFLFRHTIPRAWKIKLWVGLFLGGGQGVLGWFMVKCGLVDRPYVSHFRLAAHLSMAFFVFAYLLWLVMDLQPFWTHRKTNYAKLSFLRRCTLGFLGLLSVQILFGAFTAGLRAGYMYNTWPRMGSRFLPGDAAAAEGIGWWENLLHNPVTVQFVHRNLAWVVVAAAFALWFSAIRQHLMERQKLAANVLLLCVVVQFLLGVFTLLSGMNLVIAVSHQVCACILLGTVVWLLHEITEPKTVTSLRS